MINTGQIQLSVSVFDIDSVRRSDAQVRVGQGKERGKPIEYDAARGSYYLALETPGDYIITVAIKGLETEKRELMLNAGEHDEVFILGEKGLPFFYRSRTRVPFKPRPDVVAVVVRAPEQLDKLQPEIAALAERMKARLIEVPRNLRANGALLLQLPSDDESARAALLSAFAELPYVLVAGLLLKQLRDNATVLTENVIARFKSHVTEDAVATLAKRLELQTLRSIPYAGNAFEFRVPGPVSFRVLDVCERIVKTGLAEYAEPVLWHTVENDLITPTDRLFPEQWDHPLIGTPAAWQTLANIAAARTFGDAGVVIAIVDNGLDASHAAFAGNVTSGLPKLHQLFDFNLMVANNASLTGIPPFHGTACAGAATGRANDASPVAGVNEGTAGLAGNCRLIGIRSGGTEANFADMYVWAAGFNPNSTITGFPGVISPGADIISNSFGFSVGAPISGLMRDTFDFLTTYGRGGKGVLLLFSAGNNGAPAPVCTGADGTLLRPWGMYRKCNSITASTLNAAGNEVKASYSNFGPNVQFCAPSGSNCTGRHNPQADRGAFTPTIRTTGNVPGHTAFTTTLSLAAGPGMSTLNVANVAGVVPGRAVLIGAPGAAGTEARTVTAFNAPLNQFTVGNLQPGNVALFNAHGIGTAVAAAPADYIDNFGGTSYSTPVCAGLAALMLSANRNLTWVEVRELIRASCVKIDPNNTDPVGRWRDAAGRISADPAYTGANFSQWYGFGRINAAAAVAAAANYFFTRDIVVRDNLADNGAAPSTGVFWEGVDIWVRNAQDNVAPASYATHADSVHQAPIFGQNNWVYVRLKNIGTAATFPFSVRVYLAHWSGPQFAYPADYQPSVRPSAPLPTPLRPATYLIGEASVTTLAANTEGRVSVQWSAALVPPETVVLGTVNVRWHPCLLVEITPHDGFVATGPNVWQNNNLAQKNISISYPDTAGDFSLVSVLGNAQNVSRFIELELKVKWPIPRWQGLLLQFRNKHIESFLVADIKERKRSDLEVVKEGKGLQFRVTRAKGVSVRLPNVGLLPLVISGSVKGWNKSSRAQLQLIQRNETGQVDGGVTFNVAGSRTTRSTRASRPRKGR